MGAGRTDPAPTPIELRLRWLIGPDEFRPHTPVESRFSFPLIGPDGVRPYAGTRWRLARSISRSVQRRAFAQIVDVGAIGPDVTKTLPSMT